MLKPTKQFFYMRLHVSQLHPICNILRKLAVLGILTIFSFMESSAQLPAFLGAEGYGKFATGVEEGRSCSLII